MLGNVQEVQFASAGQGNAQGVGKSDAAQIREVGGMQDGAYRRLHEGVFSNLTTGPTKGKPLGRSPEFSRLRERGSTYLQTGASPMRIQPAVPAASFRNPAAQMPMRPLPRSRPAGDVIELMGTVMPFARNSEIYGENEPAEYLYKVISGTVRTYKVLVDGRRQIGAFHVPGDV